MIHLQSELEKQAILCLNPPKMASQINVFKISHVKMTYHCTCSKLNAYLTKNKQKRLQKIRLHIFDDGGVMAAEFYILKKKKGWTGISTQVV